MKKLRLAYSVLLALCFAAPATAGGFKFEGESLEELKLIFDKEGLSRATPEQSLSAVLNMYGFIRGEGRALIKFFRLEAAIKCFEPVLSAEMLKSNFGRQQQEFKFYKKFKTAMTPVVKVTLKTTKKTSETEALIPYAIKTTSKEPCKSCQGEKGKSDCNSCKGEGFKERTRTEKGQGLLLKKDDIWLVKEMRKACYSCKGAKACTQCTSKDPKAPPLAKGQKCWGCKGTKICRDCKGQGFREDNFFRGPKLVKDLPKKPEFPSEGPDLSTPRAVYSHFCDARKMFALARIQFENNAVVAFKEFAMFFHGEYKANESKFNAPKYIFKADSLGADKTDAIIDFERSYGGDSKGNPYKMQLIKIDNKWTITGFIENCWRCRGSGKDYNKKDPCKKCAGKGLAQMTRIP